MYFINEGEVCMSDRKNNQKKRLIIKQLDRIYAQKSFLSNYAFSLYLFIDKLYAACKKDGVTDLFFLARDGQFLKELYDEFSDRVSDVKIKTHYMYISRGSIINATLKDLENETFEWMKVYNRSNIYKFLTALQFSVEEINMLSLDEDIYQEYDSFITSDAFMRLKNNDLFQKIYSQKRKRHAENQNLYFEQCGFYQAERVAVVDVGWNGTIQNYLYQIGGHEELLGYYIGCYSAESNGLNKKTGLLFESTSSRCPIRINNYNYEYICVANHGSTYEYDDLGTPVLVNDPDIELYEKYYKNIRQTIKTKFISIFDVINKPNIKIDFERYVWSRHAKMLLSFNKFEREIISDTIAVKKDNLIDIKPKKNIKFYLYGIKKVIMLCSVIFKYNLYEV